LQAPSFGVTANPPLTAANGRSQHVVVGAAPSLPLLSSVVQDQAQPRIEPVSDPSLHPPSAPNSPTPSASVSQRGFEPPVLQTPMQYKNPVEYAKSEVSVKTGEIPSFAQFATDQDGSSRARDVQKWPFVIDRAYKGRSDPVPFSRFSRLLVSTGIQQQCTSIEFYRLIFANLTKDAGLSLCSILSRIMPCKLL
jgi:hypothetical protein